MRKSLILATALAVCAAPCMAQHITAAGATFPYPIYSKWFAEYAQQHPGVEINYQSIGSGGGISQVTKGTVDFGASDMPMTDGMLSQTKVKLMHIPTVLGAVVPVYNVPGASDLKFAPDVLADIYLGKISSWNDARIAKDNPGVSLPNQEIYRRPPLRWQWHDLHFYRLPFQGKPGVEERRRRELGGGMAKRHWRQRQ